MRRALLFCLPLLLVLPFDPQWPQAERARRGLLCLLAGLMLCAPGLPARGRGGAQDLFTAIAAWALASILWAADRLGAVEGAGWFLALALLPRLGPASRRETRALARGAAWALAVSAGYGLAQSLGLDWPAGYTVPHEPVSTLANRNAAAEWTAAGSALALAAGPWLGPFSVALGGAYLGAIFARGGLLAFYVLLAAQLAGRLRRGRAGRRPVRRALVLGVLALSPLAGRLAAPPAPPPAPQSAPDRAAPRASTIEVRLLVWRGTLDLLAREALPLGLGPTGFRARFPPHRRAREIELSSRGHAFETRVPDPHQDALLLLAELGLPGFLAFAAAAAWVLTGRARVPAEARPALLVLVVLGLTRSALLNAAAAAPVLLLLGAPPRPRGRAGPAARLPALALVPLGAALLLGHGFAAAFVRRQAAAHRAAEAGQPAAVARLAAEARAALERAAAWDPFETDWRVLLAERLRFDLPPGPARDRRIARLLDGVLARRPYALRALLERARLGLENPDFEPGGRAAARTAFALDPAHPLAAHLALEYARRLGATGLLLAALDALRDADLFATELDRLSRLATAAPPARRLPLLRLRLALKKRARRLFPADPRFR